MLDGTYGTAANDDNGGRVGNGVWTRMVVANACQSSGPSQRNRPR